MMSSRKYDVFISFRGEDTRANFTSHLVTALCNRKIETYNDEEVEKGDGLAPTILEAIEKSHVSIVILSENYASSTWCLDELVKILECKNKQGQYVIPVFYNVDPSQVRNQTGNFGKAFARHESRFRNDEGKLSRWRASLAEAASLAGWESRAYKNDSQLIQHIVDNILQKLYMRYPMEIPDLTGIGEKCKYITFLLEKADIIGIWGMGGIGKTTIAKHIFAKLFHQYEAVCFLDNVREEVVKHGLEYLCHKLLVELLEGEIPNSNVVKSTFILKRLMQKKVLIVLDDVNEVEQLNNLCGTYERLGPGSKVIITTRDRHLLTIHGVDVVYSMKTMDESESMELFCHHAFKQTNPREDFAVLTRNMVAYCGGLPLALKVLGSQLYGREITYWEDVLYRLNSHPHPLVQSVLKKSFDDLHDDNEKAIFLDISSFCIGMDQNDAIQTINGHGLSAKMGISTLIEQSLITIDQDNKLEMHVLLQKMGTEIIHERSLKKPGEIIYDKSLKKPMPGIFDVFLSFNGKDTRASFTSHLYSSLETAGIFVFMDNDELPRGEQISTSLLQAIEGSRISIIIFSKNYANSKWCMLEVDKIMEQHRTVGLVVLPVFYGVDPSEVRHQTNMFGQGFQDLLSKISIQEEQISSWRRALREAGSISGIVIINSRNENEDIKNVVKHVTRLLDKTELFVATYPVGVEYRVEDVIQELHKPKLKDVLQLGIWGIGGLGKTTIAKAIYNKIGQQHFDGRSFLLNIREVWEHDNGQVCLQQRLLSDIYKTTKIKIDSIESGRNILKDRLSQKKVLIVFDDVDKLEQLNALCGSHEWLGPGSRVIITTRDKDILRTVDHQYRMNEMNNVESLELFSWHAFKQPHPKEDFVELSSDVVAYSGGLPLALEVLGSLLFDREIIEWKSVLDKLKRIPIRIVYEKLKISYDGLSDDTEKQIFLNIAFFFIGMDRNDVIQILNGCGLFAEIGINVLKERGLVTVDNENRLGMHDLLQKMGREIIREKSPRELGKHSRLWQKDALDVLSKHTGTNAVEGLALKLPRNEKKCLNAKAFKNMKRLKLLQLAGIKLDGDFKHISRDLRWMCWHGFPLIYTPIDFYQESLVAIELEYSNLILMWKRAQLLEKLKILNLSHSHDLTQTPDFSYLPNLEKLVLEDCPRLSVVSHTIGHLNKLLWINLKDCISLLNLPRCIYKLKSLKTLILSGCLMIDKLEEDLEQMISLTTLIADKTAITQVPFSLVRSKSIGYISLCGFEGWSRDVFPSIIHSWLSPTNNPLFLVSTGIPNNSSQCPSYFFRDFQLTGEAKRILDAMLPTTSRVSNPKASALIDCRNQVQISGSKNSFDSLFIQLGTNCQVTNILKEIILQKLTSTRAGDCLLPGDNDYNWRTFNGEGSSVSFEVPQVNGRNLKTIMLCIIYFSSPDFKTSSGLKNVFIKNYTKNIIQVFEEDALTSFEEEKWQSVISNMEIGNKVEVCVGFRYGFLVTKTAISLVYDELVDKRVEHCQAPDILVSGGDENCRSSHQSCLILNRQRRQEEPEEDGRPKKNKKEAKDDVDAKSSKQPFVEDYGGKDQAMSNPKGQVLESMEIIVSKNVQRSPPLYIDPNIHDLTIRAEKPRRDLIKGKAPLKFSVSDQEDSDEENDPLVELESFLLDRFHSSSKSVKSSTFTPIDADVMEAFYNMDCLLKNSLRSLLNDEELCRQLNFTLDKLHDAEDKLPIEVAELVASIKASMPKLVDRFNSVHAIINDQRSRLNRKMALTRLMTEAKKQQEQLNNEVANGNYKKKVADLEKQIQELVMKRDMLKSALDKCEGEKKKLKEDAREWLKESKGLLIAIETNEANYKRALTDETNIETEWQGFQKKLVDSAKLL